MKQNKRLQNNLGELLENITFFTIWREGNKMKQTSLSLKKKLQRNTGCKKTFPQILKRTCQSANFLREIIKNSWLGVLLSQLQTELLCSYQTEMITFILPYFHLQRTEKHWIPFQTPFGPSLQFSDCSPAPTSFFFALSPRSRVKVLNLRFTNNLHQFACFALWSESRSNIGP